MGDFKLDTMTKVDVKLIVDGMKEQNNSWTIHGEDQQILHIPMQPGPQSAIKCEVGCMMYCSHDAKMRVTTIGTGGAGSAIMGAFSGEDIFCQQWTNEGSGKGYIGVTMNLPGKLVPINAASLNHGFTCKRGLWVANIGVVDVRAKLMNNASLGGMCCGGFSPLCQGLTSQDENAWAFLQGGGTILMRELASGETLLADSESVMGFDDSVNVDIKMSGGCFMACCGGQGLFNTKFTGPGKVYLQSMPIEKLRALFPQRKKGGDKKKKNNT